jgi:hypothetical protein
VIERDFSPPYESGRVFIFVVIFPSIREWKGFYIRWDFSLHARMEGFLYSLGFFPPYENGRVFIFLFLASKVFYFRVHYNCVRNTTQSLELVEK